MGFTWKDRQKLTEKLDNLWSKQIKRNWKRCVFCNTAINLESHHIIPRTHKATRWDLMNGISVCLAHHRFLIHIRGDKLIPQITKIVGQKEMFKLYQRKRIIFKPKIKDFEFILEYLKAGERKFLPDEIFKI